jgi:hypothetical protein
MTEQMQCKTIFSSTSHSGLKLDILKSGIQKYCRRRELKKMIRCVVEMNMFKAFGKKGWGIRTNMINRIKVMCFEELCFCVPKHFLIIMQKIDKWEEGKRENDSLLIEICNIFCKSELLRLPSDIKNYFWNVIPKIIEEEEIPDLEADSALIAKYKKEGDNEQVLKHLANFMVCLDNKNDSIFYYAFEIMKLAISGVKGARRYRRKDCDYILWEVLFDKIGSLALYTDTERGLINITPKLHKCLSFALKEYFKKNRFMKGDRIIVMVTAILWVMHKNELDWRGVGWWVEETIDLSELFVPDNYIIDLHCSAGRKAGKTVVDFATEGSLVIIQNEKWFNQKYRDAYIASKMVKKRGDDLEEGLETIQFEDFNDLEPCMVRTCGGKAMCFFANYKGKQVCLKEGRKSMNFNRDYIVVDCLKGLFGLNDLEMRRIKIDKKGKKKDKANDKWKDNTEWVDAEGTVYSMMKCVKGERLSWNKDRIQMKELVKIGLFRGIFMVTDFNLTNVLSDEDGNHWSIDEHQIGVRKTIFGKKCGWVKNITKQMVDEVLEDLMADYTTKVRKILEKMKHYKFPDKLIIVVGKNYKNLKKRAYKEMKWEN